MSDTVKKSMNSTIKHDVEKNRSVREGEGRRATGRDVVPAGSLILKEDDSHQGAQGAGGCVTERLGGVPATGVVGGRAVRTDRAEGAR